MLRFRPHSFASQDADDLAGRYVDALAAVVDALGLDPGALPPIVVYLTDAPLEEGADGLPTDADDTGQHSLTIRAVHAPEAPNVAPEVELTRALLSCHFGPPPPSARFWDEGLAALLAGRSGHSPEHAASAERSRQLLEDGLLPPLQELAAAAPGRISGLVTTAAGAFAEYVVDRHGMDRYRALLREARSDEPKAFERVYRCPLVVVDRDWRRTLEASGPDHEPSGWATVRRLLPLARPYWRPALLILGYTLIGIGFTAMLPLTFRFLIDNLLGGRPLQETIPFVGPRGHVIQPGDEQLGTLFKLVVALGLLYVLSAAARLRMNLLLADVGESFGLDLRRRLLDALGRLPVGYFARTTVADVNQRVVHDTTAVQQAVTTALVPVVIGLLSVALYAALLVTLQPRLAVVALAGLPVIGLIYQVRRHRLRLAARERVRRLADLSAGVTEFAAAQALVKAYLAAPSLLGNLGRRMEVHRQLNVAFARESALLRQSGALAMHLSQVALLLAGGYLVVMGGSGDIAAGDLVASYILLNQMFLPLGQVARAGQALAGASAGVDRVSELLAERPEEDRPDAVELEPLRDAIRFEDVGFAYAGGQSVLRGLSLGIPAGATVAFVGPTGCGKSSAVHLLPRLYDPTRGRITWDGVDIRSARLDALRRQVVLVAQEPVLLSTTLYENIRFGSDDVSDEDVERAARLAQAHDFIAALPSGYDTVIGERGVGLSGGQRQRVALARALLRRPAVLILDEATSAIDATTQRAIDASLRAGTAGRTVIKIAHRLETVADADTIFVFDQGRLVERGTHAELLAAAGLYRRLFEDQTGGLRRAGRPGPRQAARWLARLAPFAALPPSGVDRLAELLTRGELRAGETVHERGSESEELFVLAYGRVEVLATDSAGSERVVNTLGPGSTFGVAPFLRSRPHTTTVRALGDVLIFGLDRAAFRALREQFAEARAARNGPAQSGI